MNIIDKLNKIIEEIDNENISESIYSIHKYSCVECKKCCTFESKSNLDKDYPFYCPYLKMDANFVLIKETFHMVGFTTQPQYGSVLNNLNTPNISENFNIRLPSWMNYGYNQ